MNDCDMHAPGPGREAVRRITNNPCRTRADVQQLVRDLVEPMIPCFSQGGAHVIAGPYGSSDSSRAAGLEAFARPLWGLAPLPAGGGAFEHWDLYRRGLAHGVDPEHPEYWGVGQQGSLRYVEYASIAFGLLLAGDQLWTPLTPRDRSNLSCWLREINRTRIGGSNWQFFRVLANVALEALGEAHDPTLLVEALDRLESCYVADGWYTDGPSSRSDYYIPFAMHFYGLIYAIARGSADPQRAERFRQRAASFAHDFAAWFTADGAALPFGRSLIYRFAQGAFWGALAMAHVEALPWDVIKGLYMRHIRWWLQRPIFTESGLLSIGYAYPNILMAEQYNTPGSPYWAMKAFAPLALDDAHPFWQAEEAPLPDARKTAVSVQPIPRMLLCRDGQHDHVVALTGGQFAEFLPRHTPEKYSKFAYSTAFGFCVAGSAHELTADSTLLLSEEGRWWRHRQEVDDVRLDHHAHWTRWHVWKDVTVETWLVPCLPWHARVHRVETSRHLMVRESGFALNSDFDPGPSVRIETGPGAAAFFTPAGFSGIRDARGTRDGKLDPPGLDQSHPNANVMFPQVRIPVLTSELAPGVHWLGALVLGVPTGDQEHALDLWRRPPQVTFTDRGLEVRLPDDAVVYSASYQR